MTSFARKVNDLSTTTYTYVSAYVHVSMLHITKPQVPQHTVAQHADFLLVISYGVYDNLLNGV